MLESSVLDGDLRIGDFVVRPLLKVVRPDADHLAAEEATLPDKAMAVLVYLAQHSRQVCDRDDILDAVWGPEREAYDRVLDNAIREIRRALNDDARNPTYIQTIPKKGYRLLVAVESRLLEKARDSSGEFVPLAKDSPQVFQRVRRRAASTQTNAAAVAQADAPTADPAGPTDRPKVRRTRRSSLTLAFVAVLLLLATVWAWRSGIFGSDRVTVGIDASALESVSASASAAGESTPQATVLVEALRTALFEQHACGEKTLYRPGSWLRGTDYEIRLGKADDASPHLIAAEIEPIRRRAIALVDPDRKSAPGSLAREVTEQLDRAVCSLDRLADVGRACHCLEGGRRWASLPDSQASIDHLELAITLDPDLIPAYATLAEAFRAGGNFEEGMAVLKSGLAKIEDPDSTEGLGLRLQLARLLQDPSEEERLLQRLRSRHPEDPRWRLAQAVFLTTHRRGCEEALELLKPLMAQDDRPAELAIEMWRARWLCGQTDGMADLTIEAVEGLPRHGEIRRWLAVILSLVGRYEKANHYATEAMALEPELSESYWVLGIVADRQGHYSAAENWYQKANDLASWPKQGARATVGLARVARLRGETSRCIELASSLHQPFVLTHEPPSLLRGLCLVEAGRTDEARRGLEEFRSSLIGQSSWAHRAQELLLQAKIEMAEATSPESQKEAARRFVEATESYPIRIAMVAFEAATALAKIDDLQGAEDMLGNALAVNPNHPWSLCRLGMIHKERGDFEAAAETMSRGLQVFGPRLEDPLAVECAEALLDLDPGAEIGDGFVVTP